MFKKCVFKPSCLNDATVSHCQPVCGSHVTCSKKTSNVKRLISIAILQRWPKPSAVLMAYWRFYDRNGEAVIVSIVAPLPSVRMHDVAMSLLYLCSSSIILVAGPNFGPLRADLHKGSCEVGKSDCDDARVPCDAQSEGVVRRRRQV